MRYRTLGDGLEVSAIGIGCMPMVQGGNIVYGGNADPDDAVKTSRVRESGKPFRATVACTSIEVYSAAPARRHDLWRMTGIRARR